MGEGIKPEPAAADIPGVIWIAILAAFFGPVLLLFGVTVAAGALGRPTIVSWSDAKVEEMLQRRASSGES